VRILIIGGTGFVGTGIVRVASEAGHEVMVYHRGYDEPANESHVPHVHGDALNIEQFAGILRPFQPDAVIDTSQFRAASVDSVVNFLAGYIGRYVMLSSVDVYRAFGILWKTEEGPIQSMPVDETADLRTAISFDSMRESDDQDNRFAESAVLAQNQVSATVVRLPSVFGIGDKMGRVSRQLERIFEGGELVVKPRYSAAWRHSYGYLDNIVDGLLTCAADSRPGKHLYNLAYPDPVSDVEWFRLVADAVGWSGTLAFDDAGPDADLNMDQELFVDSTKIRTELGYKERVGIEEAVRKSVEWEMSKQSPGPYAAKRVLD